MKSDQTKGKAVNNHNGSGVHTVHAQGFWEVPKTSRKKWFLGLKPEEITQVGVEWGEGWLCV